MQALTKEVSSLLTQSLQRKMVEKDGKQVNGYLLGDDPLGSAT